MLKQANYHFLFQKSIKQMETKENPWKQADILNISNDERNFTPDKKKRSRRLTCLFSLGSQSKYLLMCG